MIARKKLVAGNWKMNGSLVANETLIKGFLPEVTDAVDVVVFVPAPYLAQVQGLCQGSAVKWGAQDVSSMPNGAYTGEVSLPMLEEFGVTHVLVGHSERRTYHFESSDAVADKALAAIEASIVPIVCVGETLQEREAGRVVEVINAQLDPVFDRCGRYAQNGKWPVIVAYEPVWAIGTGVTASPEQAQEVHAAIRQRVQEKLGLEVAQSTRVLYGGSVKPSNAAEIFAKNDIDGGLIGGAALSSSDFSGIIRAARG
ncbi:triose-phosphate isomerase [Limnobacter litoralis]|uniref:Triosephosphate isomerase n=1 Tax=Limnobacter litoralis TaxID=481366 RepID=A0ABQ5YWF2_9BURK|nr:triose-phosphate isomerase [Limnobacter litoralis]GLR26822.1 triosephosphate isomerase [Limnobacter litoralis]